MPETQLEMHADHQYWLSDHAMWRDNIELWQNEVRQALEELKQVERALRDHAQAIQEHTALIARQEQAVRAHEASMAHYAEEGIGEELAPMRQPHHEQAARYERLREAHEYLKRHHHMMLAKMSLMLKALGERAQPPQ